MKFTVEFKLLGDGGFAGPKQKLAEYIGEIVKDALHLYAMDIRENGRIGLDEDQVLEEADFVIDLGNHMSQPVDSTFAPAFIGDDEAELVRAALNDYSKSCAELAQAIQDSPEPMNDWDENRDVDRQQIHSLNRMSLDCATIVDRLPK